MGPHGRGGAGSSLARSHWKGGEGRAPTRGDQKGKREDLPLVEPSWLKHPVFIHFILRRSPLPLGLGLGLWEPGDQPESQDWFRWFLHGVREQGSQENRALQPSNAARDLSCASEPRGHRGKRRSWARVLEIRWQIRPRARECGLQVWPGGLDPGVLSGAGRRGPWRKLSPYWAFSATSQA